MLISYYFLNVEVFDYTFREAEMCDELSLKRPTLVEPTLVEPTLEELY